MKRIYHRRWGIETSFLELKYALGAISFHSKKDKFILQELYAEMDQYRHILRDGRHNIRLLKPKSAIYFTYRIA